MSISRPNALVITSGGHLTGEPHGVSSSAAWGFRKTKRATAPGIRALCCGLGLPQSLGQGMMAKTQMATSTGGRRPRTGKVAGLIRGKAQLRMCPKPQPRPAYTHRCIHAEENIITHIQMCNSHSDYTDSLKYIQSQVSSIHACVHVRTHTHIL